MKVRSLEIVNATGGRVLLLDGDVGVQDALGGIIDTNPVINWPIVAASVNTYIWTALEGIWQVTGARSKCTVSGGTGATVDVMVCSGVVAPADGVTQLAAPMDVEVTAPFQTVGVLIASPTLIYPGGSIALVFAGTLTGLVGIATVSRKRVG